MILLLVACAAPEEGWAPDPSWTNAEVAAPEVLTDGLDQPAGLAVDGERLIVAERGGGRLLAVGDAEEVLATDLDGPWMVAAVDGAYVVTERDGGRVLAVWPDGAVDVLAEGLTRPGRVVADGVAAWVVDEGGALWRVEPAAGTGEAVAALSEPTGLVVHDGVVLVAERGASRLVAVDPGTGAITTVRDTPEAPVDVVAGDGEAWVITRSTNWPGTGSVYRASDGVAISDATPYASFATHGDGYVWWSTHQVIARAAVDGYGYEAVAVETSPGDLRLVDGAVVWTDAPRGALLRLAP